jgi:hypothetical protein
VTVDPVCQRVAALTNILFSFVVRCALISAWVLQWLARWATDAAAEISFFLPPTPPAAALALTVKSNAVSAVTGM